jgi:hypothetical protein
MSTFVHAKVACAACAHVYDADVAEGLHISTRPDIREDIVAGRFHRFRCPACAAWTTIEKLLAYTDFTRHHWFTVVPTVELPFVAQWREFAEATFRATMLERSPALVQDEMAPRLLRRLVFGLASLREKLIAFDHGLDDRVLEIFKLELLRERGVFPDARLACHLLEVSPDALVFELALPGAPPVIDRVSVDRVDYDRLAAGAAELAGRWPELWDDLAVDWRALFIAPPAAQIASEGSST